MRQLGCGGRREINSGCGPTPGFAFRLVPLEASDRHAKEGVRDEPVIHTMVTPGAVPASFETALAELEAIVATMEGGQLPLEASLASYKRGAELLQYCQAALKDAEQQVRLFEKGILKAFDSSDAEPAGSDES